MREIAKVFRLINTDSPCHWVDGVDECSDRPGKAGYRVQSLNGDKTWDVCQSHTGTALFEVWVYEATR